MTERWSRVLLGALALVLGACGGATVQVRTDEPCLVALIAKDETAGKEYGWWTVWHERKTAGTLHETPYTFEGVAPGDYVLVAYDPASVDFDPNAGDPAQASDGAVIESLHVTAEGATITIGRESFVEWNCLSCPWLSYFDGTRWVRVDEVLKDVVGADSRTTVHQRLPAAAVVDGRVRLRIHEEKDEVTWLDFVGLEVGGVALARGAMTSASATELAALDEAFAQLPKGSAVELAFELPAGTAPDAPIEVVVHGYYEPSRAFIDSLVR